MRLTRFAPPTNHRAQKKKFQEELTLACLPAASGAIPPAPPQRCTLRVRLLVNAKPSQGPSSLSLPYDYVSKKEACLGGKRANLISAGFEPATSSGRQSPTATVRQPLYTLWQGLSAKDMLGRDTFAHCRQARLQSGVWARDSLLRELLDTRERLALEQLERSTAAGGAVRDAVLGAVLGDDGWQCHHRRR
ncbi:hypothetical protein L1887_51564 [Cichorium endivia]|nr:hypothetical protein L1887_51564 [Cichorium endivia]